LHTFTKGVVKIINVYINKSLKVSKAASAFYLSLASESVRAGFLISNVILRET
jgi:hypothetical protein